jgi:hypothetical protein
VWNIRVIFHYFFSFFSFPVRRKLRCISKNLAGVELFTKRILFCDNVHCTSKEEEEERSRSPTRRRRKSMQEALVKKRKK